MPKGKYHANAAYPGNAYSYFFSSVFPLVYIPKKSVKKKEKKKPNN